MRICLYTETALPMLGGQEIVVDALARGFMAAGHLAVVLAPSPRSGYQTTDRALRYPLIRHPRFFSTRRLIEPYSYWLRRLHRRYEFDIFHCHSIFPTGYLATRVASHVGPAVVITSHGGDLMAGRRLSTPSVRQRYVEALTKADALIAINEFTAERYRELAPNCQAPVRIPNGVDTAELFKAAPRPDDLDPDIQPGRYVMFIGRLSRRKGVDLLLKAFGKILPDQRERLLLVIAGVGEEDAALKRQVGELGLATAVRFVGKVEQGHKTFLLQNSLVNIVPSREWEGLPLTVLESFAAGRPLIATRIPGLESIVRDGQTGWLVNPNSVEELAAAIRFAMNNPVLRERLGQQARAEAKQFDWKIIAESHLDLFARLIGRVRAEDSKNAAG